MNEHIKKEDAVIEIERFAEYLDDDMLCRIKIALNRLPSADVIEVGKAYPKAELEKYGLTEWKDKDGHKWVMVERRNNE